MGASYSLVDAALDTSCSLKEALVAWRDALCDFRDRTVTHRQVRQARRERRRAGTAQSNSLSCRARQSHSR